MMQLGAETVFVGSGIFKSSDPKARARAIVDATTHYNDPGMPGRSLDRASARPCPAWTSAPCPKPNSWQRAAGKPIRREEV